MYESLFIGTHLNIDQWQTCSTVLKSGLGLESGLFLSPFLLDLDLGRFVTKSIFNFHCAHLQCFV